MFRVIAISGNRDAFGLRGVVVVNRRGQVYQFASHDLNLPKLNADLQPPMHHGTPLWSRMGFEIPERLSDMPAHLLSEVFG
jgi:hypothetical protein